MELSKDYNIEQSIHLHRVRVKISNHSSLCALFYSSYSLCGDVPTIPWRMHINPGMATIPVYSPDGPALFIRYEYQPQALHAPLLFIAMGELNMIAFT